MTHMVTVRHCLERGRVLILLSLVLVKHNHKRLAIRRMTNKGAYVKLGTSLAQLEATVSKQPPLRVLTGGLETQATLQASFPKIFRKSRDVLPRYCHLCRAWAGVACAVKHGKIL